MGYALTPSLIAECHKNATPILNIPLLSPHFSSHSLALCVFDWLLWQPQKSLAVCLYFLISGGNNNASKKHKFPSINKELLQAAEAETKLYRAIITRVCQSLSLSVCVCMCVCAFFLNCQQLFNGPLIANIRVGP